MKEAFFLVSPLGGTVAQWTELLLLSKMVPRSNPGS